MDAKAEKTILRARKKLREILADLDRIDWNPANRSNELSISVEFLQDHCQDGLRRISKLYHWLGREEPA